MMRRLVSLQKRPATLLSTPLPPRLPRSFPLSAFRDLQPYNCKGPGAQSLTYPEVTFASGCMESLRRGLRQLRGPWRACAGGDWIWSMGVCSCSGTVSCGHTLTHFFGTRRTERPSDHVPSKQGAVWLVGCDVSDSTASGRYLMLPGSRLAKLAYLRNRCHPSSPRFECTVALLPPGELAHGVCL